MPRLALTLALTLTTTLCAAARAVDPDPKGLWEVEGGGTLEVTAARGEGRYHLRWETPGGGYEGIGLQQGRRLVAAWGPGAVGLMLTRRQGDGWVGEWTTLAAGEATGGVLGREAWPGAALEGERDVTGARLDGRPYAGRVTVARAGEAYDVRWTIGAGERHVGVGLPVDASTVTIAFGEGAFGVAVYDLGGVEGVEGRYCAHGADAVGIERLRRLSRDPAGRWALEPEGTVTVTPAEGDGRFDLRWETPTGPYEGLGLLRGGRLVVGWGRAPAGAMLVRRQRGVWVGEWTDPKVAEGRSGLERWPAATLVGSHAVEGRNPSGTAYVGQVEVTRQGDVLRLRWTVGDRQHHGVGLLLDADTLAVAFGVEGFGLIVYDLRTGDRVEGRWCTLDDGAVGVERLRRDPR
ncbi:MAG: hypothetical protein KF878_24345 [Planctomycetes bacterium]|nr:hypothetical protein [Planctomycetota bacterium]